ncbi:MAG: Smr/MutS family protein, partial [Mailhella sp.]|nr:Smr/MutS family protein [Mailhella sp.]
ELGAALDGRCVPLEEGANLHLPGARHPLLVLEASRHKDDRAYSGPRRIEPADLMLREGDRVLVISGGNAGGKTVALKTLGLITLMALAGLPAPVDSGATLPFWNKVCAFIGDEQSLDDHVSTFTGQIRHLSSIWDALDSRSLVLLDEFGAGTDPSQGAALAQAVLDGLLEKGAYTVTATHFPALKTYALTREGVRAASVLFDPSTKKPLFHLAYDQVGASQALDVAREHGLPESVLRRAEHYLLMDGDDATAVMERLNELARQREEELARMKDEERRLRDKRQALQEKLEKERARLDEEVRRLSQELMRDYKSGMATAKQTQKEMAKLRADLAQSARDMEERPAADLSKFTVGGEVLHRQWNKKAVVRELNEKAGKAKIDMGGVTMWAPLADLEPGAAEAAKPKGTVTTRVSRPISYLRLDLRGKRADLALAELEQFLDRSLLSGTEGVEIVHGRGTGALRKAVHELLRTFPGVASYSLAPEDQGGDGMTQVLFR